MPGKRSVCEHDPHGRSPKKVSATSSSASPSRNKALVHWLKPRPEHSAASKWAPNLLSRLKPLQAPVVAKASFEASVPQQGHLAFLSCGGLGTLRCEAFFSLPEPPSTSHLSSLRSKLVGTSSSICWSWDSTDRWRSRTGCQPQGLIQQRPTETHKPHGWNGPLVSSSVLCKNQYTKIKNLQYTICKIKELKIT